MERGPGRCALWTRVLTYLPGTHPALGIEPTQGGVAPADTPAP